MDSVCNIDAHHLVAAVYTLTQIQNILYVNNFVYLCSRTEVTHVCVFIRIIYLVSCS